MSGSTLASDLTLSSCPERAASYSGIQAVLFDLDGTLYSQWPIRLLMGLELLSLVITERSFSRASRVWKALAVFRRVREELRDVVASDGSLETLQYVEAARRFNGDPAELERWVTEWMFRRPLKYLRFGRRTGLSQLLSSLEYQGIPAGVLSDYPARDKLQALGLSGKFSLAVCATDAGVNAFKPRPAGFLRACEVWGLSPAQVLYVGDRPEVDAAGADAAGMRCVIISASYWFRGPSRASRGYLTTCSFRRLQRAIRRTC